MPLDAICLSALAEELRPVLEGGRIDKVYQPGRYEVVLAVRGKEGSVRLLLSANPNYPRAQLTQADRENPDAPPMFCMLLRKYVGGGRIVSLEQPPLERVLFFCLECVDELGDKVRRTLVLEAMGRGANLLLLDGEGRIVDCIRRVEGDLSAGKRQLLPGLFYRLPPPVDKLDLFAPEEGELMGLLAGAEEEQRVDGWLLGTFGGLSPLVCRELAFQASGEASPRFGELGEAGKVRLAARLEEFRSRVRAKDFTPWLLREEGRPKDFSFLPILQYGMDLELERRESFSALLDEFYAARESAERVRQRGQDLIKAVTAARDRTARKLENQRRELASAANRQRLRELGDIVTANLYAMERGMSCLRAADFYDPQGGEVEIPLDPLLTPQQNAAKYYKDYNKAKKAEEVLTLQIQKNEGELEYLGGVLENLILSEGERDLQEIRQELTETGYLRRQKTAGKREKRQAGAPMEFRSSTGRKISVGKNNAQNDRLTAKMAFKSDLWFHVQKLHGAHVILWTQGEEPDVQSMHEAAVLAATFSQGREGKKIPVDYTLVKYVKKPAGARPGMVVYTTYQTVWVDPNEALAGKLRVK